MAYNHGVNQLANTFPPFETLASLIDLAWREDLNGDDVTSRFLVPQDQVGVGTLVQRGAGVSCGLPMVQMICNRYDQRLIAEPITGWPVDQIEGRFNYQPRTPLLRVRGPMRSLLSAERVILNFLQHMGGIATLTNKFVQATRGTRAKIFDTRKTIPGHRLLEKYAVRAGGGMNHRIGLYDGLLVKDNHLAGVPLAQLTDYLRPIVERSRAEAPNRLVEIEVDTLDQLRQVLKVDRIDVILLDNMDCPTMQQAVRLRDESGNHAQLEASGGITLETTPAVAQTGVERIAVGAITHSAPALDIGLDIELTT